MAAKPAPRAAPTLRARGTGRIDLLAIGASTGGPQALQAFLGVLGPVRVPVLVTQHMPATFTRILAQHLERAGGMPAAEAVDGEPLLPGRIYVAPGDWHMRVVATGSGPHLALDQGAPENFCRPAVDPMLRSVAETFGGRALAVILTGMGQDGMLGAGALVAAGGTIVTQDAATSVVWGMPGAVVRAGHASFVSDIDGLGRHVRGQLEGLRR